MAKIRVNKCERVDNPYYRMLVEKPHISTHYDFGASIRDRSRFGGLFILYNKETL